MSHNLNSLFEGNLLIHQGYAASFVPTLYKAITSKQVTAGVDFETALSSRATQKMAGPDESGVSSKTVVVLGIKQPIIKYSDYWIGLGTKSYMRILDQYRNDDTVAGIVLDIDSGGGQVYGTPEFYDYIAAYPKPIVTYTDGYLCSAAYYIGNASKWIVANKRADAIGSIGAYATMVDFDGLWEKLGAKIHTMYATKSKKKNFEARQVLEKGDTAPYITQVLDPIVDTFHADMKATRPGLNEAVFAGDTWNGPEALTMGLVDELGTLDTAVLKVFELDHQTSNQNSNNMSKQRASLQAALGLDAPLAVTDKGSYLNDEQLDGIETNMANSAIALDAAKAAKTKAEGDLATEKAAHQATTEAHTAANAATETAINTILTDAGLEVKGTLSEKIDAIATYQAELNGKDGATTTKTLVDGDPSGAGAEVVSGFDLGYSLNS